MRMTNQGFTYVGLLIFIAILGMTAAATVSLGALAQRRHAEEELLVIGLSFRHAFMSYYHATPVGQRRYPTRLEDLLKDPRYPNVKRHLRQLYADPLTGKAEWGMIEAPGGGIMGIYSLSHSQPIKIGLFPPELMLFEGKTQYSDWVFAYSPGLTPTTANFFKTPPSESVSGWK